MIAAAYLGVPPWELAQRPLAWTQMALACREMERFDPDEQITRSPIQGEPLNPGAA